MEQVSQATGLRATMLISLNRPYYPQVCADERGKGGGRRRREEEEEMGGVREEEEERSRLREEEERRGLGRRSRVILRQDKSHTHTHTAHAKVAPQEEYDPTPLPRRRRRARFPPPTPPRPPAPSEAPKDGKSWSRQDGGASSGGAGVDDGDITGDVAERRAASRDRYLVT